MAYYTILSQQSITNLATTLTHNLSITAASLVARVIIHQPQITCTAPVGVATIGTNIITVFAGVGTATLCDVEVQLIHSIIS